MKIFDEEAFRDEIEFVAEEGVLGRFTPDEACEEAVLAHLESPANVDRLAASLSAFAEGSVLSDDFWQAFDEERSRLMARHFNMMPEMWGLKG